MRFGWRSEERGGLECRCPLCWCMITRLSLKKVNKEERAGQTGVGQAGLHSFVCDHLDAHYE